MTCVMLKKKERNLFICGRVRDVLDMILLISGDQYRYRFGFAKDEGHDHGSRIVLVIFDRSCDIG